MHYLATHDYKVIALGDLSNYTGSLTEPADPLAIIQERQKTLQLK
jgi:hypothetical protein